MDPITKAAVSKQAAARVSTLKTLLKQTENPRLSLPQANADYQAAYAHGYYDAVGQIRILCRELAQELIERYNLVDLRDKLD